MSGHIDSLSDVQKEKLTKLRENVKDILQPEHGDVVLLKFLRARHFDLKKSEKMFRKDVEWRRENQVSTILDTYEVPEVFKKFWCGGVCGISKEGHGVYINPIGNIDPKGILYSVKGSDILKTYTYHIEYHVKRADEYARQRGVTRAEGRSIMVFDLENLGLHHLWKPGFDMFQKTTLLAEQHYPELIHKLFVIRAPKIFPVTFNLIKPFLREDTRKKIHVVGNNWKEELLKHIDPDQLPVYWGGTMTDPDGDEKCPSLVMPGGKVPKSFYLKDREPPHTLTAHEVSRGGAIELKYEISHPDSVLRYEFQTDCADIKFGVDRVEGKKKTPMVKLEKYNSHMVPENGEVMIQEPGTYVARFDNSHSWTKSKKLLYWIEVLEPTDETEQEFDIVLEETVNLSLKD